MVTKRGRVVNVKRVGHFSQNVIDLLNLSVAEGTPIFIGEVNEKHMRNRHEYEFNKYYHNLPEILDTPDYVGINPHDDSIMYVKEYVDCGEFIRIL